MDQKILGNNNFQTFPKHSYLGAIPSQCHKLQGFRRALSIGMKDGENKYF